MSHEECWVPVRMRWRNVRPGDVVLGRGGVPWMVVRAVGTEVAVTRGDEGWTSVIDPDHTVQVLVPPTERDALVTLRSQLGAEVSDRQV